jgi:hypothetical protein
MANLRSAKSKAESILKPQGTSKATKSPNTGLSQSPANTKGIETTLRGLSQMTIGDVGSQMSPFNEGEFKITDVRSTGHLPQATVKEHSASMANMAGAIRLLELHQEAAKVAGKTFDVVKERATTYGKGVQAVTQIEKVKGDLFKYQEQTETNGILGLRVESKQAERAAYTQQVVYDKQSFLQKVEQAKLAVELMELSLEANREKLRAAGITPTQQQVSTRPA